MSPDLRLRLWELFAAHAEGTLDVHQHAELEEALRSDPEARTL